MATPAAKREAVAHLAQTYEMSERRARRLIKGDCKTVRYRSRRPRDEALRLRLKELAAEQRRFGYSPVACRSARRGPCGEPQEGPASLPGGRPERV